MGAACSSPYALSSESLVDSVSSKLSNMPFLSSKDERNNAQVDGREIRSNNNLVKVPKNAEEMLNEGQFVPSSKEQMDQVISLLQALVSQQKEV